MVIKDISLRKPDEIYVECADVTLGPYSREQAARLVAEGEIDPNWLARVGLDGRVFPAKLLIRQSVEDE